MKKLRFYLNKEFDKVMAEQFFNIQGGGIDFGQGTIKTHPKLKTVKNFKNNIAKKKALGIYLDEYYKLHKSAIAKKLTQVQKAWQLKENKYFTVTQNYFNGFNFLPGKYIAYASVINCNPRFLDSKTFQFFYKKSIADAVYTITHELLHFIFFDFVEKKLKKEIKHLSEDQLWDLSEIFNIIVLKSPIYSDIIDQKFIIPYPDHRSLIPQFEKVFKISKNAEEFIRHSIPIISVKK